ncbi:MAG: BspA family leucine-rich repeat surface protein [Pseudobutyrivibrio sp.]|nr:BspA family leucine-rich repeat surface protein [Pseudobutyrivibrio sp.]
MSNIERKYAYYDEGVLPEVGENGVTYLTLYSSDAGNIYDGWIYDPDNKIPVSVTERTFGYRRPESPQYCWDDEVVVDLSNAQNRKESSEFASGRIWSFNTNVSPRPIIVPDTDITGLTEDEREAKATTILFTAIPLVSDAYIQAQIEVQAKCNLSPNNTSGMMRVEAFYILNDESDRTMRPDPVHTFFVGGPNERRTLPWIYANPALNHETNNYIGVKVVCTGGTLEIGVSDDPEYGDAMITLMSAGLTGDKVLEAQPVRLWMEGLDHVSYGHKLSIEEYDVFAEYDDGSVYLVTHFCDFDPRIGTPIYEDFTLYAEFGGLMTYMDITVAVLESIELEGLEMFTDSYTLDIKDFTVYGYSDDGGIEDLTNIATFSPAMGTTITQDTTLTASVVDPVSQLTLTDDLLISKATRISYYTQNGMTYSLYDSGVIIITGNAESGSGNRITHYPIDLPSALKNDLQSNSIEEYVLRWEATGKPSGIELLNITYGSAPNYKGVVRKFENFDEVNIVPRYEGSYWGEEYANAVYINMSRQRLVTSEMLEFLGRIDFDHTGNDCPIRLASYYGDGYIDSAFSGCSSLRDVNFMSNWLFGETFDVSSLFQGCSSLYDISGLANADMRKITTIAGMFQACTSLKSVSDLYKWKLPKCQTAMSAFASSGLETTNGVGYWRIGKEVTSDNYIRLDSMFQNAKLKNLVSMENFLLDIGSDKTIVIENMFADNTDLENISQLAFWSSKSNQFSNASGLLYRCAGIEDASPLFGWTDLTSCFTLQSMLCGTKAIINNEIDDWELGNNCNIQGLLSENVFVPSTELGITYEYTDSPIVSVRGVDWSSVIVNPSQAFNVQDNPTNPSTPEPPEGTYRYPEYKIPGYEDKVMHTPVGGAFAYLDLYYITGSHTFEGRVVSGTVYIHFINASRLPQWYMELYRSCYDTYTRNYYTRRNYTYTGTTELA